MPLDIRRVEYYNATVDGNVGAGAKLLSVFAGVGVSLLAFKAVPLEPKRTQFSLFPNDGSKMTTEAAKEGLELDGPHSALLIQGDDKSGALSDIYDKLSYANITICESSGIADINGSYGVIFYLEEDDREKAVAALQT